MNESDGKTIWSHHDSSHNDITVNSLTGPVNSAIHAYHKSMYIYELMKIELFTIG